MFKWVYLILFPVLLGVLIIHSQSLKQKSQNKENTLIRQSDGEVVAEEFKYYKIYATGDILIELQSL